MSLPVPPADGPPLADDVLGELGLIEVLSTALAPAEARRAGAGWGGDRYVLWTTPAGASCLRLDIVGDTPDDSQEIRRSLTEWARAQPHAEVIQPAPEVTRVTTCR